MKKVAAATFFRGAARVAHTVLAKNDCFAKGRGFAPAGATKGLSDRPLETFGAILLLLSFSAAQYYTIPILNDYKDTVRRSAEGDRKALCSPLQRRNPFATY